MAGRNDTDPLLPVLRLVIVRHGETTANAQGICQGQSPDPSYRLTPLGVTIIADGPLLTPSFRV